jgi:deoxyribonuclease V
MRSALRLKRIGETKYAGAHACAPSLEQIATQGMTRKCNLQHPFELDPDQAARLQIKLARQVVRVDRIPAAVHLVAGVDAAYRTDIQEVLSAVALFDVDQMRVVETVVGESHCSFPYVPGLFSFREIPAISAALEKLKRPPDLVICDGHGVAHPRRFGLAAHLGVLYDLPSVGCAKTRLIGEAAMPAPERGASSPLIDQGEVIGAVLRTQAGIRPVYVSTGHRISLETACAWILRLCSKYRLPEPIRAANQTVNTLKANAMLRSR